MIGESTIHLLLKAVRVRPVLAEGERTNRRTNLSGSLRQSPAKERAPKTKNSGVWVKALRKALLQRPGTTISSRRAAGWFSAHSSLIQRRASKKTTLITAKKKSMLNNFTVLASTISNLAPRWFPRAVGKRHSRFSDRSGCKVPYKPAASANLF